MKRCLFLCVAFSILVCVLVSCATNSVQSETTPVEAEPVQAPVQEDTTPKSQIIFNGDEGKLKLVLSKDDMSAKLYKFDIQVKQGFWTSASIGYSANLQIFIDGKPANLFLDPITNEYSIDMTYDGTHDVMRCGFDSWFGKCRKFNSFEESSGEIICYGASNFAYWTLMESDLAPYLVHNHSVGGVTDKQLLEAAPELLYPYNPKVVMLLTGSNDYANIADVSDGDAIVASMMEGKISMYEEFHANLPEARIVVIGGMPTVKRAMYTPLILKVNSRIEEYCNQHSDYMTYCSMDGFSYDAATDTYHSELFLADELHLTPEARVTVANEYILPVLDAIDAPCGPVVNEPYKVALYPSAEEIPFFDGKADEPWFEVYQVESDEPTKAIIVFHGGGFMARSIPKESTDIGEYFSREYGYTCFVCYYRINTDYKAIVSDGIRFLKQIRSDAEKYNIDPDKICLMGFSAGGNLALAVSQHYDDPVYTFSDEMDQVDGKPDYFALIYPGISMMSKAKNKYLKWDYTEELAQSYEYWRNVREDMGSAFFAQAKDDITTPIDGTYTLMEAMREKGVDFEFHEFTHGDHGFALGNNEETVTWMGLFADWFDKQ